MNEQDTAELTADLAELAGFMVVSARGLMDEPPHYGPFRLIDAASRLVATLERHGLSITELSRLREAIEAGKESSMGTVEEFRSFLDELVLSLLIED